MFQKTTLAVSLALIATLTLTPAALAASAPSSGSQVDDGSHDTVQGWQRTYSEADGVVVQSGEATLKSTSALQSPKGSGATTPTVVSSGSSGTYRVERGTSYVQSKHPFPLAPHYNGQALAAGNLYQGQYRVASARFKYYRTGDNYDSGWKSSNATINSKCQWTRGKVTKYTAFDSLKGGDAYTTRFGWNFVLSPKNLC